METTSTTKPESAGVGDAPWAVSADLLTDQLNVNPREGLSAAEVKRRLKKYGRNQLRRIKSRSWWVILGDQVKSLVVLLLVAAAVVSLMFGEMIEAGAIGAVLLINTLIGFVTELRAVRSMEALRKLGGLEVTVRREGSRSVVPADAIVPGDIVILESGDAVPADLRLIETSGLQADESTLTGESVPVSKQAGPVDEQVELGDRASMVYKGTNITQGSGVGVVVRTGMETELGEITALVEEAEDEETPLEQRLEVLGRRLVWVTLSIAVLVTVLGIVGGRDLFLMIETGIALAVAAVPEGLPIVATLALARGMWRMVNRHALVRRLSSVETLGSTTVICTDKTGTLTENRMAVQLLESPAGPIEVRRDDGGAGQFEQDGNPVDVEDHQELREMLVTGVLCNRASLAADNGEETVIGDPMEVALLEAGEKAGLSKSLLLDQCPRVREVAFDTDTKMMATFHDRGEEFVVAVKGAPEAVLEVVETVADEEGLRAVSAEERDRWLRRAEEMAADGLRVLALASKTTGDSEVDPYGGLQLLGLVGLLDPPRGDVRAAINRCQQAGVRVVMVTGDHAATAKSIARSVGLIDEEDVEVMVGADFPEKTLGDTTVRERLLETPIFARVTPGQKLQLIDLHQEDGAIVAMTGDGVNDAPALKSADIGIAMGQRGTEVAREAADMVLLDDAFSTIVAAVEEGRIIFNNIRNFVRYLLSCNVGEILTVGVAAAVNAPLPVLPLQILFLNLVTDVFPALALGVGRGDEEAMSRPPRDPDEPTLTRSHWVGVFGYGAVIGLVVLATLQVALTGLDLPEGKAVTISFLTLALAQLWHVFNMRDPASGLFRNEIVQNPFVWGALVLSLMLVLGAVYISPIAAVLEVTPPSASGWLLAAGASLVPTIAGQIYLAMTGERG